MGLAVAVVTLSFGVLAPADRPVVDPLTGPAGLAFYHPPHTRPRFTPSVRADAGAAGSDQNEPQVTVDQSGTAYVTWQAMNPASALEGFGFTGVSKTRNGARFTSLGYPDPATPTSGIGTGDIGDVTVTHASYFDPFNDRRAANGASAVFWGNVAAGGAACRSALQIRNAVTTDGAHWTRQATAGCQRSGVDRPWVAAFTPARWRGRAGAASHTAVYYAFHDYGPWKMQFEKSSDGSQTWVPTAVSPTQRGSPQALTTACITIPGGIAVDQNGAHQGRIYLTWSTTDLNSALGGSKCDEAEAFDHVFLSYSDDAGRSWKSRTVFNDPCSPDPPRPPREPSRCQDVSEIFSPVAVDDAGNVYVAYVWRDITQPHPQYDVYVAASGDGGNTFTSRRVTRNLGTHYMPALAAGGDGGIDVAYYATSHVVGTGAANKPAAAPNGARWTVQMSQSLDRGRTWTQSQVSDHPVYFGDICTTGGLCDRTPQSFNWSVTDLLHDNLGIAVGPDGGARVAWTDAQRSWNASCRPGSTPSCQTTHIGFACQRGGKGVAGQLITACGKSARPSDAARRGGGHADQTTP